MIWRRRRQICREALGCPGRLGRGLPWLGDAEVRSCQALGHLALLRPDQPMDRANELAVTLRDVCAGLVTLAYRDALLMACGGECLGTVGLLPCRSHGKTVMGQGMTALGRCLMLCGRVSALGTWQGSQRCDLCCKLRPFFGQGARNGGVPATRHHLVPQPLLGQPRQLLMPGPHPVGIEDSPGHGVVLGGDDVAVPLEPQAARPALLVLDDHQALGVRAELSSQFAGRLHQVRAGHGLPGGYLPMPKRILAAVLPCVADHVVEVLLRALQRRDGLVGRAAEHVAASLARSAARADAAACDYHGRAVLDGRTAFRARDTAKRARCTSRAAWASSGTDTPCPWLTALASWLTLLPTPCARSERRATSAAATARPLLPVAAASSASARTHDDREGCPAASAAAVQRAASSPEARTRSMAARRGRAVMPNPSA